MPRVRHSETCVAHAIVCKDGRCVGRLTTARATSSAARRRRHYAECPVAVYGSLFVASAFLIVAAGGLVATLGYSSASHSLLAQLAANASLALVHADSHAFIRTPAT